jgi:phosphoglycolate phosphatase
MAKDAGLMAVWARYGDLAKRHNYRKLVAISHWTEEDVLRARELVRLAENLEPDATIDSFPELLSVLTPSRSVKEVALG